MGIFDFLKKNEVEEVKNFNHNHIKNLILITMSDGQLDEQELNALNGVAKKLSITEDEVNTIIKNFRDIQFVLPEDRKERVSQLWDMILIILIDRKIQPSEITLFSHFAQQLGVRPAIVSALKRNLENLDLENETITTFKSTFLGYFSDGNAFID